MKPERINHFLFLILIIAGFSSCVSRKKYIKVQHESSYNDSVSKANRIQLNNINDSLRMVIEMKDSIIDSLTNRLNGSPKKDRPKSSGYNRKSRLSPEVEIEKKSLFLYNFTKYIEWPIEYNGTEFVIGVAGDDKTLKSLQSFMSQKKVSGKKIIVEKYKKGARYNLVYVTSKESYNFQSIRSAVRKMKTLIVSDDSSSGTHIFFIEDQDKVKYYVDPDAIENTGLKVGQELLRLSENKSSN